MRFHIGTENLLQILFRSHGAIIDLGTKTGHGGHDATEG